MRTEQRTIDNIILFNPLIYGLQQQIESEQESVIADLVSPAQKVVKKLFELDDRRIDLCNLNVLYGFIERELGEKFGLFCSCVFGGASAHPDMYKTALRSIELAGYTAQRVNDEFAYLFKLIKRRPKRVISNTEFGLKRAMYKTV